MPALTATDWTVTFISRQQYGQPPRRRVIADLALAGVNTYPAGGIPMPTIDKLGFKRNCDLVAVSGLAAAGAANAYVYDYDAVNNKLLLYSEEVVAAGGPLPQALATEVPGPITIRADMVGW